MEDDTRLGPIHTHSSSIHSPGERNKIHLGRYIGFKISDPRKQKGQAKARVNPKISAEVWDRVYKGSRVRIPLAMVMLYVPTCYLLIPHLQ
jgi:hypothetical protein